MPWVTQAIYAQVETDRYQLRQDDYDLRHEGIKDQVTKNVNSDRIDLLSALIVTNFSVSEPCPPVLVFGFYTKKKTPASVQISYEPKRYYVEPAEESWGPGNVTFRWPTDIIQRHRIPYKGLYARAVHVEQGQRILFPGCLYSGALPDSVLEYQFWISPQRSMRVNFKILEGVTETLIYNGTQQRVGQNKQLMLTWNGLDNNGRLVPAGEYILKIEGSYRTRLGRRREVSVPYRFYHRIRLTDK